MVPGTMYTALSSVHAAQFVGPIWRDFPIDLSTKCSAVADIGLFPLFYWGFRHTERKVHVVSPLAI